MLPDFGLVGFEEGPPASRNVNESSVTRSSTAEVGEFFPSKNERRSARSFFVDFESVFEDSSGDDSVARRWDLGRVGWFVVGGCMLAGLSQELVRVTAWW